MKRAHVAAGLVTLAFAAFFAAGLPFLDTESGYAGLSPRTVPIIVAVGLALWGALLIARPASVPDVAPDDPGDGSSATRAPRRAALAWVAGGLVADMVLIGFIGFVLASVVLMVCVARGYGSSRPLRDALVALVITVPLWLLFTQVLGINLPLFPMLGR